MSAKESSQGFKLPAEDAAESRRATDKALAEGASIDRHGGWGTFIVLAVIFVFLQILSVLFGYRWGFAGHQSKDAYRAIGGGRYSSYSEVREHYKDIADTAQSKLEHLQQKMMQRNSQSGSGGLHTTKTFYEFIKAERLRETADRMDELRNANQRGVMEKPPAVNAATPPGAPTIAENSSLETLSMAMQKIRAMGDDKEAKRTYIESLPDALNEEVKQALRAQKEAAVRKASQRDAELDDLLS